MNLFERMAPTGHEQVVFCRNSDVGLRALVAIHDTTLGPGLGGVRLYHYPTEDDALRDVLRLSRHMTLKSALAGVDAGGAQAVLMGDPAVKGEALFRAFGRHVESLGGRFIAAEDMNTTVEDMNWIRRETRWVVGSSVHGGVGDPAPVTAWGVYQGIRACLEVVTGNPDTDGHTVAIQGIGAVGYQLARHLHEAGAKLVFADISARRARSAQEEFGGEVVDGEDFYSVECDVLAPCAVGGVLNSETIPHIRAPIVAGGANNQLEDEERDGEAIEKAGITYAPDFAINSGGLIHVYGELMGRAPEQARADAANIFNTIKRVINTAKAEGLTTTAAAHKLARERIDAVAAMRRMFIPRG